MGFIDMDNFPNLSAPRSMAAQAQKHLTHIEALRALDAITQPSVLNRDPRRRLAGSQTAQASGV